MLKTFKLQMHSEALQQMSFKITSLLQDLILIMSTNMILKPVIGNQFMNSSEIHIKSYIARYFLQLMFVIELPFNMCSKHSLNAFVCYLLFGKLILMSSIYFCCKKDGPKTTNQIQIENIFQCNIYFNPVKFIIYIYNVLN